MIEVDKTYAVIGYPFYRDTAYIPDDEGMAEVDTWRPGIKWVDGPDSCPQNSYAIAVADGQGEMLLTVVDIHKPGRYPTRVFFTRQWKDPEGKIFGKGKLHIKAQSAFKQMLRGYRHHYSLPDEG